QSLEQGREHCRRYTHHTVAHLRPHKLAALQPLVHQHHSRPVPDQNLHTISSFRAEHKGRPTERIKPEHLLHQRRKSIMTFTEVHRACRHVYLQIGTRRNHRDARIARITPARYSTSTSVRITTSLTMISSFTSTGSTAARVFGINQPGETLVPRRRAVLAGVTCQKPRRPQLMRIAVLL